MLFLRTLDLEAAAVWNMELLHKWRAGGGSSPLRTQASQKVKGQRASSPSAGHIPAHPPRLPKGKDILSLIQALISDRHLADLVWSQVY